jgi:hypothetical protein
MYELHINKSLITISWNLFIVFSLSQEFLVFSRQISPNFTEIHQISPKSIKTSSKLSKTYLTWAYLKRKSVFRRFVLSLSLFSGYGHENNIISIGPSVLKKVGSYWSKHRQTPIHGQLIVILKTNVKLWVLYVS